jgi:site-specific DNA recombinase
MKSPINLRLIGYTRVSSYSQAHNTSLETQQQAISSVCTRCGYELVSVLKEQETASGQRDRSVFHSALCTIQDNKADGLIVYSIDRFARSALQGLALAKWLHEHGKQLVVVDLNLDTYSPFGKCMFSVLLAFAELEHSLILQRVTAGKARVKERNGYAGGSPGYGWIPATVAGNKGLLPDAQEQQICCRIKELAQHGLNYSQIAGQLNKDHIPSKRGKLWRRWTVRNILLGKHTKLATWAGSQENFPAQQVEVKSARLENSPGLPG